MNNKIKVIFVVLSFICVFSVLFVGYLLVTDKYEGSEEKILSYLPEDYPRTFESDQIATEYIEGLEPEEGADDGFSDISTFVWDVEPMTRVEFVELLLTYNKKLAYKPGGRRYGLDIPTYDYVLKGTSFFNYEGLDSLGFIDWAYRCVTGTTIKNLESPELMYNHFAHVEVDDLQIGDIGMAYSTDHKDNIYGIYVGVHDKSPVFALVTEHPFLNMQVGCLHFSYLKEVKDDPLDKMPSVSFSYFVRPDVKWEDGDKRVDFILDKRGLGIK